jgi:hypothetical protein
MNARGHRSHIIGPPRCVTFQRTRPRMRRAGTGKTSRWAFPSPWVQNWSELAETRATTQWVRTPRDLRILKDHPHSHSHFLASIGSTTSREPIG